MTQHNEPKKFKLLLLLKSLNANGQGKIGKCPLSWHQKIENGKVSTRLALFPYIQGGRGLTSPFELPRKGQ